MVERPPSGEGRSLEQERRICKDLYTLAQQEDPRGLEEIGFAMSLALGLRGGVHLSEGMIEHSGDVQRLLSAHGVEALVDPASRVIANTSMLAERLRVDAAFAKTLNWENATPEDVIAQLGVESPLRHARLGFVLGFPLDSIRGFMNEEALRNAGAPAIYMPETANLPIWEKKERFALQKIQPLFARKIPLGDPHMAMRRYHEIMDERDALFGEISNMFLKRFPINQRQMRVAFARQSVYARTPETQFPAFGLITYSADDFESSLALRAKIVKKFTEVGW